jgi:hypothetical protein
MGGAIGGIVGGLASSVLGNVAGKALEGIGGKLLGGLGDIAGSLISKFGGSNVAGAMTNSLVGSLGGSLTNVINNSPLPSFLKNAATDFIGNFVNNNQQPTTPDCQCAVDDSYGDMLDNISQGIAKEASGEANEKTKGGGGEGGNWLVALAGSLAGMQTKFLDAAMDNMATMNDNAAGATYGDGDANKPEKTGQTNEGGQTQTPEQKKEADQAKQDDKDAKRDLFVKAQSEYQANMQMFNMMANMTATSIKSLGEGLTSLARKQ